MILERGAAVAAVLTFILAAQGVTEFVPQSGQSESRISADGRYVLHQSGPMSVYDTATGVSTLVPLVPGGGLPNAPIYWFELSGDGQTVAFATNATNLAVPAPPLPSHQTYVIDLATGQTTIVSKSSAGVVGDGSSHSPAVSDDGRFIAFTSWATNLVPIDTNGYADVFVHDRLTQVTTRASEVAGIQAGADSAGPRISGNGEVVYFHTNGATLTGCNLSLHHVPTATTQCAVAGPGDGSRDISRLGRYVTYRGFPYVYRLDLWTGSQTPVNVLPDGFSPAMTPGVLSPDGGFWLFENVFFPGPFKRTYLRDLDAGVTHVVNVDSAGVLGDAGCVPLGAFNVCSGGFGDVSDFGRHVTFWSQNTALAPGAASPNPAVFVHHRTPHLSAPLSATIGTIVPLVLASVEHPGKPYVVGLSTGYAPGVLIDWRWAPLVWDDLLVYSLTPGAPFLVGFSGALDGSGNAAGSVQLPALPGLSGFVFYAAFGVLSPNAPSGIAAFSNATPISIL